MEQRSRKLLAAVLASVVVLVLLLLAGWSIFDSSHRDVARVVPQGEPATERDKLAHDINNITPVFVPVAYLPGSYAQSEPMTALRRLDDEGKAIWQNIQRLQESRDMRYVVATAADPRGYIWVGCEDSGLWRYDLSRTGKEAWKRFGVEDGLAENNVYAVAVDRQGRLWAGHLNHGLSVFNGSEWRNYEVVGGLSREGSLSGPLGERIFAIAVCPTDGDVWIATNAGLTRYSTSQDTWRYYTRGEGLPSDQAAAIAFDRDGRIYVGTQCDGIAIADATDDYRTWRIARGPDRAPLDPAGSGLPSSLINDLLVGGDGTVYAGTPLGLAYSKDEGQSWQYVRGKNWIKRVRGLYGGPPAGWTEKDGAVLEQDEVACIAEDERGLWIVNRDNGCDLINLESGTSLRQRARGWTVRRVVATPAGLLLGTYGDGQETPPRAIAMPATRDGKVAPLPSAAKPPSDAQIAQLIARCKAASQAKAEGPLVVSLDDDWRNQGDWLGRYGRYWACLAAIDSGDYLWGPARPGEVACAVSVSQGRPGNYLGRAIAAMYTSDPRSLEIPPVYMHSRVVQRLTSWEQNRRQAEWNDCAHGQSIDNEGPDIYCNLTVPPGLFCLSLYAVNKDGRSNANRHRDFLVSVRAAASQGDIRAMGGFEQRPELARSRIKNFWHGCYKRFLVQGPVALTVRIGRNYSFNTMLSGVMLDPIDQFPQAYFAGRVPAAGAASTPADELADAAEQMLRANPAAGASLYPVHVQLLRWYSVSNKADDLASAWRPLNSMYRLRYFAAWEAMQRKLGIKTAREIEQSLRWDGKMQRCSGLESVILSQWLSAQGEPANGARPQK